MIFIKTISEFITESNKKDYHILYHSSDSAFFDILDYDKAKKGERFFNPLGNGLYCTTNLEFSKTFGKNTYYYLLPKNAKIKKVTHKTWPTTFQQILKSVLKKYNIDYWNDITSYQKVFFNRLSNDSPISSLNELQEVLSADDYDFNLSNVQDTIESVVDKMNMNYDAIWYKDTDFYLEANEILIPISKFKKELFVNKLPE